MPYTKQAWNDNDPSTPLSAARLLNIESGIAQAQASAEVQKALGPNWIAASNAPSTLKNAISAAGGFVCSGAGDQAQFTTALATFKTVFLTEGTFNLSASITPPQQASIIGSGYATKITGSSGLAFPFFNVTTDRVRISQMYLDGTGTSSSCHGIVVAPTASTGFIVTTESGVVLDNLFIKSMGGDGIRYTGSFASGGHVNRVHIYGCVGRGFYTSSADGSINQMHVEACSTTGTSHGLMFDTGSAGWRVSNVKAYLNAGDGFSVNGARHNLTNVEAQDNQQAGFRLICTNSTLSSFTADSNSWKTANANAGIHSGVEVGLTGSGATASGGLDITISGGQAWDRNDASRGRAQRSGIRVRTGAVGLTIMGVTTGDTAGSLFNATNGIEFLTASDAAATTNCIYAISNRTLVHST